MRSCASLSLAALLALAQPAAAETAFESKAPRAILIDVDSGGTLYRKAADERFDPAAMAKMMTMAVVFDALKAGEIRLDQTFKVSENAWRKGGAPSRGATMFAALKSEIAVSDLLRGAIVQAGNDACLILAEGMAGSEAAFVTRMNDKARALGLTATTPIPSSSRPPRTSPSSPTISRRRIRSSTGSMPSPTSPGTRSSSATAIRCFRPASASTVSRPATARRPASAMPPRHFATATA